MNADGTCRSRLASQFPIGGKLVGGPIKPAILELSARLPPGATGLPLALFRANVL